MSFQLVPDDGRPPRIVRFSDDVEGATLDVPNNVLTINKKVWDDLDPIAKKLLEKVSPQEVKLWNSKRF